MKKFKILFLCLTLVFTLFFTACGPKTPAPTPTPEPEPEPEPPSITVTELTISQSSATLIFEGANVKLTALVKYSDGTSDAEVIWRSDNADVATVSDGTINSINIGEATITAIALADASKTATCEVKVITEASISLNASATTLIMGKGTAKLDATIIHKNGTVDAVASWVSAAPANVTVSADGTITPVAVGSSVITATATDEGKALTATCTVVVVADATTLTSGVDKGLVFTIKNEGTNATLGYKVKAQNKDIVELTIPDSYKGVRVTEIEAEGFRQCTKIASFSMGKSINKIGANAFKLETTWVTTGESIAFTDHKSIISAKLRANIKLNHGMELDEWALADSFFKIVTIPEGTTTIPAYAFTGSTVTKINFPTTLTQINGYAFAGCLDLVSANLSQTKLAAIGTAGSDPFGEGNSFLQCGKLKTIGTLPATLKTIGTFAFSTCSNLTEISLNAGLEKISAAAFMQCAKIPQMTIPASVTKVGANAFSNWGNDQKITVPFAKNAKPADWKADWAGETCKAVITYKA